MEIPRCTRDDVPGELHKNVTSMQNLALMQNVTSMQNIAWLIIAARHPERVFLREGSPECCTIQCKWRSLVALGMTYVGS